MGAPLNLDGVQHQKVRELIDAKFRALVDGLEDAYYGTAGANGARASDGWRHSLSHPWRGFDKRSTPQQSKQQFDELHGLIWWLYTLVFHEANKSLPPVERIDRAAYDEDQHDDAGLIVPKVELSRRRLRALREARPVVFTAIRNWALGEGFAADVDAMD